MSTVSLGQRERLECPVVATAQIVSGKWTLVLLRDLADGPRGFRELERSLTGISPATLSHRLRVLEEHAIVERREPGPRARYALTDKGRHLVPIVEAMREYGTRWLVADGPVGVEGC